MAHKQRGHAVTPHPKHREPDDKPNARKRRKMREHEKRSGVARTASDKLPNCDRKQQYRPEKPDHMREDRDVDLVESFVQASTPRSIDHYLFAYAPNMRLRSRIPIFHQQDSAVALGEACGYLALHVEAIISIGQPLIETGSEKRGPVELVEID